MTKIFVLTFMILITTNLVSANGGDQRLVEKGKYFINLSRAPFTPHVGVKTSFVASFFDVATNRLISENLIVRVRISKLGDIPKGNFIFDQENIMVKGGVLEFPYTFSEAVLHEIFFDFAFASNPERVYNVPDFLMDVQNKEPQLNINRFIIWFMLSSILGVALGFVFGFWVGKRRA